MSGAEWIRTRTTEPSGGRHAIGPPARLLDLVRRLAEEDAHADDDPAESLLKNAGEVVTRLLRDHQTARDSALELLAADALATYAFEAQADSPEMLDVRCEWAMTYLSRIAEQV